MEACKRSCRSSADNGVQSAGPDGPFMATGALVQDTNDSIERLLEGHLYKYTHM